MFEDIEIEVLATLAHEILCNLFNSGHLPNIESIEEVIGDTVCYTDKGQEVYNSIFDTLNNYFNGRITI